jgi:hypothetical protein
LGSLLKTAYPPFDVFAVKDSDEVERKNKKKYNQDVARERRKLYLNLLIPHIDSIMKLDTISNKVDLDEKKREEIDNLFENTGTSSVEELVQLLKKEARKYDYYNSEAQTLSGQSALAQEQ